MEVKLAEHLGFCFGVKKAVDEALKVKEKANTLGPLIHNKQVVEELDKKGIKKIDNIDEADSNNIIIRTHGASDRIKHEIISKGYKIIDLTCPFVKKLQQYAKDLEKEDYQVIIIGEKNHPEVIAIADDLKEAIILEKPEDADALESYDKIGIVVQTTQTIENFTNIVKRLENKAKSFKIHNTICNATKERQKDAVELAKNVGIMIVVGGYDSANTKQLAELCSKIKETKHIEKEKDLKQEWFKGKNIAGVTAGASTPSSIIEKIIKEISSIQ